jgi:hypothetical protein
VVAEVPDALFILSSNQPIHSKNSRIVDGGVLTQNAELTKYCSMHGLLRNIMAEHFRLGKTLPMIQLLKPDAFYP